ncbi:hypothetical protein LCGC14_2812990 [marine sediment metagenome]|uniref:Phosphoribosyltransferase domain-containing protein n=1 Tax=marine sediment metagenome TaxID=412755 RepID=A0A0F8YJC6_9ZZZZ
MNFERYKKTGSFTLSSGKQSQHYYDVKEAMGEPQNLQIMFSELIRSIPDDVDLFIGLEYGGIPLAVTCSLMTGKPYAILRKHENDHGMRKRIEGYQGKGNVVLLDDVKTTGLSLKFAKEYLEDHGYNILDVLTIMERE